MQVECKELHQFANSIGLFKCAHMRSHQGSTLYLRRSIKVMYQGFHALREQNFAMLSITLLFNHYVLRRSLPAWPALPNLLRVSQRRTIFKIVLLKVKYVLHSIQLLLYRLPQLCTLSSESTTIHRPFSQTASNFVSKWARALPTLLVFRNATFLTYLFHCI